MKRQISYYIESKRELGKKLEQENFEIAGSGIFSARQITHYLAELHGPYLVIYSEEEVSSEERDERSRLISVADKLKFNEK